MANSRAGVLVPKDDVLEIIAEMYIEVLAVVGEPHNFVQLEIPLNEEGDVVEGIVFCSQTAGMSTGRRLRRVTLRSSRSGIRVTSIDLAGSNTFLALRRA